MILIAFFHIITFVHYVLAATQYTFNTKVSAAQSYIDLDGYLNNKGVSGEGSDFDGAGNYFTCPLLSKDTAISFGGIGFQLSEDNNQHYDNVISLGQIITLPKQQLGGIYMLTSVSHGPITANVVVVYQDGTTTTTVINIPDWQVRHSTQIERIDILPCRISNGFTASLASTPLLLDPSKTVSHLVLPYTNPHGSFKPVLHVFGITTVAMSEGVKVISAKGTRRWSEDRGEYQIITVRVHNTSPNWASDLSVFIEGALLKTKYHGNIKRLAPGHIVTVDVAILTLRRKREPTDIYVEVLNPMGRSVSAPITIKDVEVGLEDYETTSESLGKHGVPSWFSSAKFGIFIHWGVYSVPSWAPVGQDYAEWYWWNLNQKYSPTYNYHRAFYGPDFEYDDFIELWKPDKFNPTSWLDLVDRSGAKYFVFTSKHHDGFSLYDTDVNDRSSVKMNPYRNFLKELLDKAKSSYPHLKRGIYFSLPEWYHPSYHDRSINWDGPPKNPYTNKILPYHGAPAVNDFVNDVQVPQIHELIHEYEPDIMWCDIGGINNSTAWQATFLNEARKKGKQVTMNDRCGNDVSDFATIEYRGIDYVPERFWEATRGVDPHSFGYNHQTKPYQYTSVTSLLMELVSTIAKGGNFLLNIGPEASGWIPSSMYNTLIEIGRWVDKANEAIFDTVPYWVTSSDFSEPGQPLYFMQSKDGRSIYIFSFERLYGERLILKASLIPLHKNTKISLLTKREPENLKWKVYNNGRLIVDVPDCILDTEKRIWVFKIEAP
ncbi:unnamed protein product [Mucor hiemalis]